MHNTLARAAFATSILISLPAAADPAGAARAHTEAMPAWRVNLRRAALIREGEALARKGAWADARARFQEAIEIRSQPKTLLWIGYCDEQLGYLRDAQARYEEARAEARAGKLGGEERDANQAIAMLDAKIPRVTFAIPPGVEPIVSIDGRIVNARAEPIAVDPGPHRVTATATGRRGITRSFTVEPGGKPIVEIDLPREDPPPPPPPPPAVRPANDTQVFYRVAVISGAVLSAAAAGAGVGLAVLSARRESASELCNQGPCEGAVTPTDRASAFNRLQDQKVAFARASVGAFVGAGLLAAGTAIYAYLGRARTVRVGVAVSPGGVASSVSAKW